MKGSVKRFRPSDVNPRPYKAQNPSPLRDLLFLNGNPKYIRVDPAHTFAIDGIGKDYYASSVILLMMSGWFGNGNTDLKFNNAYSRFMAFCDATGKSTSIHEFSYKGRHLKFLVNDGINLQFHHMLSSISKEPRLRGFPRGLGKGHDAAVVGAWLNEELRQIDVASADTRIRQSCI